MNTNLKENENNRTVGNSNETEGKEKQIGVNKKVVKDKMLYPHPLSLLLKNEEPLKFPQSKVRTQRTDTGEDLITPKRDNPSQKIPLLTYRFVHLLDYQFKSQIYKMKRILF